MQSGRKRVRTTPARDESTDKQIERAYFYGVIATWDACSHFAEVGSREVAGLAHVLDIDEEVYKFRTYFVEHRADHDISTSSKAEADADAVVNAIFESWRNCYHLLI
ncbi:hypothetical protein WJX84_007966 [Apatococcus fuscideae]|uniref:Uncharacterized protein n=1 Tax=Apatococcus fuscideae TaxID=2026836 RepID=A0AAW1T753_9CHLO